jgi:hypothetical protein
MIVFINIEQYIISIKKNIICQDSNMIMFIYMEQYIIFIKKKYNLSKFK